jgi:hypothetical protein
MDSRLQLNPYSQRAGVKLEQFPDVARVEDPVRQNGDGYAGAVLRDGWAPYRVA